MIIVTQWPEPRDVDERQAAAAMARPLLSDGRNVLIPQRMGSLGFTYMRVGRRTVRGATSPFDRALLGHGIGGSVAASMREETGSLIAGVGTPPAGKTRQGWEYTFDVNFLGPFALTGRLYPLLEATPGSRVVTVSSFAYVRGAIDFDNLKSEKGYDAGREYGQNKLADLMFTIELDRRVRAQGHQVVSIAAQPGANSTEITRHSTEEQVAAMKERFGGFMEA
ncbi:SDR family NAD(P)-dependent oxidoreductase [Streptomyces fagopyri]|uniref:SDR family NAD(P)-dependent oxidoreductase n=1 Tax=Streptomyces fagopyri TaxID=2662397 RepID=UPI00367EE3ED